MSNDCNYNCSSCEDLKMVLHKGEVNYDYPGNYFYKCMRYNIYRDSCCEIKEEVEFNKLFKFASSTSKNYFGYEDEMIAYFYSKNPNSQNIFAIIDNVAYEYNGWIDANHIKKIDELDLYKKYRINESFAFNNCWKLIDVIKCLTMLYNRDLLKEALGV